MNNLKIAINSPWKAFDELRMYLINPFVLLYLRICGVQIDEGSKFYGFPIIKKYLQSKIIFGKNFENRNWLTSNPLGVNHATIFTTWEKDAKIKIGDNVGITGGVIC